MFKKLFLIFFTTAILLFAQSFILKKSADAACVPVGGICAGGEICCGSFSCISSRCCDPVLNKPLSAGCYCDVECSSGECRNGICDIAPPANPIYPRNGAEEIQLVFNAVLGTTTITIQWEPSTNPLTQKYIYQYWEEGTTLIVEGSTTAAQIEIPSANLIPKTNPKYHWHLRSCSDFNGNGEIESATECGSYSSEWTFKFLLGPPQLFTPAGNGISLPVTFDWGDIVGAQSYFIKGEINFDQGFLGNIWNSIQDLFSDPGGWFVNLGLKFVFSILGVDQEAVKCPYFLWDDTSATFDCVSVPTNKSDYTDDDCFFTKNTNYKWQVASCLGLNGKFCGRFSGELSWAWKLVLLPQPHWECIENNIQYCHGEGKIAFSTNNIYNGAPFTIPAPILIKPLYDSADPTKIPVVGYSDSLGWNGHPCGHIHKVIITRESDGKKIEAADMETLNLNSGAVKEIWDALDSIYDWQVRPCFVTTDNEEIKCEPSISPTWRFKTTGAPPQNLKSVATNKIELSWREAERAESYRYEISTDQNFSVGTITKQEVINGSKAIATYPHLLPNTPYWWHVKTCADKEGDICGNWSNSATFTTLPLNPPTNPNPTSPDGQLFVPGVLSWNPDPGASFYQIRIANSTMDPAETLEGCETKEGAQIVPPTIISEPHFYFGELCQGEYMWQALSCWDKDCVLTAPANWSDAETWTFFAVAPPPPEEKGLLPCGRRSDNLDTPYNERESCQLKHAGFLIQNILDFLLWRLGLIIMAILAVVSGVTSYFSLGSPNTLVKIKSIWKSAGIGWSIMLLAWTFISLIMNLIGFLVEFFGRWWQLPF